jgi:hypothetical protein
MLYCNVSFYDIIEYRNMKFIYYQFIVVSLYYSKEKNSVSTMSKVIAVFVFTLLSSLAKKQSIRYRPRKYFLRNPDCTDATTGVLISVKSELKLKVSLSHTLP